MTAHECTINQLVELFHQSRKKGEWVNLSMESKDGKDSLTFSIRNPTGYPAGPGEGTWKSSPCCAQPKRRKSPSQWRRDRKRKEDFLAKKTTLVEVKEEEVNRKVDKAVLEMPSDEIELTEIPVKIQSEPVEKDLFKIVGTYKNPKYTSWTVVEPGKEVKTLWEALKVDNEVKGIEEIGEGSTCFEHSFEFWGTWKTKKPEINSDFLRKSENWPRGIKILEVKPA